MPLALAIISLGVLIFVHELGHFLAAKLFGIYVERFSLGFGPKVVGITIGETEYQLAAVPLGGYVKLYGEDPEEVEEENTDRSFAHKPIWQRTVVVLAGPLSNIIFAWMLVYAVNLWGVPTLLPEVGKVVENSPAQKAGLKPGDLILAIDGRKIASWDDMAKMIHARPNSRITLTVKRNGKILHISLTTQARKIKNIFGETKTIGLIGIYPSGRVFTKRLGPIKALGESLTQTYNMVYLTVKGFVKLIKHEVSVKSLGGPILIVQMATKQAQSGILPFLLFTALISVNLGIINLLPIPILDGGHILLFAIEAVRREPLSLSAKEKAQQVGLAIIILIMLVAMYNDIARLLSQKLK